jgi:hypothetical protein
MNACELVGDKCVHCAHVAAKECFASGTLHSAKLADQTGCVGTRLLATCRGQRDGTYE